jgi:hypothetical protein
MRRKIEMQKRSLFVISVANWRFLSREAPESAVAIEFPLGKRFDGHLSRRTFEGRAKKSNEPAHHVTRTCEMGITRGRGRGREEGGHITRETARREERERERERGNSI